MAVADCLTDHDDYDDDDEQAWCSMDLFDGIRQCVDSRKLVSLLCGCVTCEFKVLLIGLYGPCGELCPMELHRYGFMFVLT